ncbi:MAG TPA: hypothetical protein VNO32_25365, partial [Candidatus Acidoferrum sp.]|nr:hypothetical protein [Candidatus Acidoferrum sp.]
ALLERNINVGFHGRINYTSVLRKVYHDGLRVNRTSIGGCTIVVRHSGAEGKEKRGLPDEPLG